MPERDIEKWLRLGMAAAQARRQCDYEDKRAAALGALRRLAGPGPVPLSDVAALLPIVPEWDEFVAFCGKKRKSGKRRVPKSGS